MGHESDEKIKDISTVIILSPADVEYTVGFSRLNFPDLFFYYGNYHMLCVRTELTEIMVNQVLLNKSVGNGWTSEQT